MKKQYERPIIQRINSGVMSKFGYKSEQPVMSSIDGLAVKDLISEYGSPLFVLSEQTIRQLYKKAERAFKTRYPKVQFAWSYKTNYLNAVCNIFHQEGLWAEVVSGFEYDKALNNGVPGNKIIFNGPHKADEHLRKAIQNHSLIHIDHFEELQRLTELAEEMQLKPDVAIRINMDTGIYPVWDRFGFNFENGQAWEAIQRIIAGNKLNFVGLHCHIGTFMLSPQAYAKAVSVLANLALRIKSTFNIAVRYIDIGGGFASENTLKGSYLPGSDTAPSADQFAEAICNTLLNAGFDKNDLPLLVLETGRALIDEAGYLLGSVIASKRLSDGRRATIVDFGVNIMFTSFWYDHKISPAQVPGTTNEDTVVCGPLCMNIDVLRTAINLPLLSKGDQLVVHTVGAYNMTQWMQFIALRPSVVLIDTTGKAHQIRKAETLEDIERNEIIPEHLIPQTHKTLSH
jgi:diaminopimelate decarboxylase